MSLLEVTDLHTRFDTSEGTVHAVDGVDLNIEAGDIVGLVGESGSGKSVTARSIMRLINSPGEIADGEITFNETDILAADKSELRSIRGNRISMIFQDPQDAFNPTQTIGRQLHDVLRTHESGSVHPLMRILGRDHSSAYRERVVEALDRVGIPSPETRYDEYPHQFSGGMLQRAMIAMAVLCEPELILADEPTTALDVTVESRILLMFRELVDDLGISVLWITHDLSIVSELCDRVVVMYAGKIMEEGPTEDLLENPQHPYTRALLESVPRYDMPEKELFAIDGSIPSPHNMPQGCRFADRCPEAHERCYDDHPPMYERQETHAACYLLDDTNSKRPEPGVEE
ncbi:ABC transporter ATP-binding protein [Natronolimnobius baerhuensis]|uniref:ABC transporter domain-containing protein n=1 Tax=Natronolimnobius baerhuensis TaxID=253108 RepID=A0A202E3Q2_9EURY|nr:ABC transporter ATP-binding protein [Natronolimnobius baerhuensis]OVE82847.1 hypothetical protein B2G88_18855 [Natronolimnobius baerhuensis]